MATVDQRVLDTITRCREIEVFSISGETSREAVHGMRWSTLQSMTVLTARALDGSTDRLIAAGLINCNSARYSLFGLRLGRRSTAVF